MMRIGFIVNPYAGMGGAVGLKGTDDCIEEAVRRGAVPTSPARAKQFLEVLKGQDLFFFTAGGSMGEDELSSSEISSYRVLYPQFAGKRFVQTTRDDTIQACKEMMTENLSCIVFCGGDGTARDVFSVTGNKIPILGIPSGVKIYSGVFARTPESAAEVLKKWNSATITDAEVLDIDEDQYRSDVLSTSLYGIARIPYLPELCQSGKQIFFGDENHDLMDIAVFITDIMQDDTLYLLGAGSTTGAVAERLGICKTLLGIDAVYQGHLIARDLNESAILDLLARFGPVKILLSPIGAQGFILGRGNQQISARVLRITGTDSLIIVATPGKLQHTPVLYVDTGDPEINKEFGESILVICGYRMGVRVRLKNEV